MAYLELIQFVFRYAAHPHNTDDFMFAEIIARLRNLLGISVRLGQFDFLGNCRKYAGQSSFNSAVK